MKSLSLFAAALLVAAVSSASVVQPLGTGFQLLIPAAGSTPGANNTFFRSDISIVNLRDATQTVSLQWIPQAGTGQSVVRFIDIPARSGLRSADFVSEVLGQSGLGSIIVTGTNVGQPDTGARLFVSSRIWTPQPGTTGTTSQSFEAIPVASINTPAAVFFGASGQDNPVNYRVNVGIVNLDPANTQTFTVSVPSALIDPPLVRTVTLPPSSMTQINLGSGFPGSTQIQIRNGTTGTSSNQWTAYVSTVDNVTGDAFSELPIAVALTP